jgi:glycosyltransferase involved in cell wall biosynthesis
MGSPAVLHITSLPGGGVDRHLRDIAHGSAREHLVWHAAEGADVIEASGPTRFTVVDPAVFERDPGALTQWLARRGVGIVHAHALNEPVRRRAQWAAQALGVPSLVTLHDILFLRRDAFDADAPTDPDAQWLAQTAPFLREAAAVLAPSDFLADLARAHIPGLAVDVVPNGSPPPAHSRAREARPEFTARGVRNVVAVLGAIGPHKGSALLDELAPLLEGSGIAIVIIGYHGAQLPPGWRGNIFIHGPYAEADVAPLLRAYGAKLALFPNAVPESFSYSLSDVWSAGLPAIVPPRGALRERVARHGGGWVLPEGFGAVEVAALLRRLVAPEAAAELAQVRSRLARPDVGRVPALDAMTRSLDAFYARFGIDPGVPVDATSAAAQELIAKNLDGALFRQELVRILDEMQQMKESFEGTLEFERGQLARARDESRQWIAKLEADIATLQAELAREVQARARFEAESEAFGQLPELVRRLLLKRIGHARS